MRVRIALLIFLTTSLALGAQTTDAQVAAYLDLKNGEESVEAAFAPGERLTFVGSYSAALIPNIEAGTVEVRVSRTMLGGVSALNIYGNARSNAGFRSFFDLNDTYQSWLDEKTLRPLKHTTRLREGNYRFNSDIIFDWDNMEVNSVWRNLKRPYATSKTMKLNPESFDAVSLFYNLRSKDISNFKIGEELTIEMVLEDTIRVLTYRFLGREQITLKKLGTFNSLKFSCTIATSTGKTFRDGTELYLWVTDDKNRMPLYVESPIRIGSVKGYLTSYSGLKYPLDSKVPETKR